MTAEEFFTNTAVLARKEPGERFKLVLTSESNIGGWSASNVSYTGYGDTLAEAIEALCDRVMMRPSRYLCRRRAGRMDPPEGRVIPYDYRSTPLACRLTEEEAAIARGM